MNSQLVFVKNNSVVTDTVMLAKEFKKLHKHVVRDVEIQMARLIEAEEHEFVQSNFGLETFTAENNKESKKYNLSKEAFLLVAMGYTTAKAMKMKLTFIREFDSMSKLLNQPRELTESEQLIASMKLSIKNTETINKVQEDVRELQETVSERVTLDHGQQAALHHQIKKRVESIYPDFSFQFTRQKLYSQIHSHLRRAFQAPKYVLIRERDFQDAMSWVGSWRPMI